MSGAMETPKPATPDPLLLDEGDPRSSPRGYRRALGQFATGVTVVTARTAERAALVTANSFTSVSLDPPLVLWSLRRESGSLAIFRTASHFAVNVLAADQVEVSTRFARSSTDGRIADGTVAGRGGAPVIPGAAATFECRLVREDDGGDHVIFVGEVERYASHDRPALLFAAGRYALPVDHPDADPPPALEGVPDHRGGDDYLIPLLLRAYIRLSNEFDEERTALGLDLDGSKILASLAAHAGGSVGGLARETLLGLAASEDAVAGLIASGLAALRPPGAIAITTEGRRRHATLLERAAAFEATLLSSLEPAEVAATRRVLAALGGGRGIR